MSLVLTLMQNLRTRYRTNGLDKNEMRRSRYGAWDFFRRQSIGEAGVIDANMRELVGRSFGNTVQVPVLDAEEVVISNVRACTVADSENTSKLVTLTFVTYSFGFTMTPSQHFNNDLKYQQDFDRKLEKYLLKFAAVLDTAAVSNLSTNKNQYFPADITAYYPVVGNALQIAQSDKNDFYNQASAILNTMDFYGQTNVVSSTTGKPMVNRLQAQGAGNSVNEDFQFGGYEWNYTNRLTNAAGVQATVYLVGDGQVGVLNRNDPDALARAKVGNHKLWDIVRLPIVDLDVASYYYEDCADKSALHAGTTGLTRTKVEGYEWSTDICFINSYNSDPANRYGPILKAEILAV